MEFDYELVSMENVPIQKKWGTAFWKRRFEDLPEGKAGMAKYNNRQRAHQVRLLIRSCAKYWGFRDVHTRIIHAEPAIHDTDGWLVYFWRDAKES